MGIIDDQNKPILKQLKKFLNGLKEGEEYYFYKSPDELIVDVAKLAISTDIDKNGNQKWLMLCPISSDKNYYIERESYVEKLDQHYSLATDEKKLMQMREGKRVVHFTKLPLEKALVILTQIIEKQPGEYVKLTNYLKSELLPLIYKIYNENLAKIQEIQNDQYDNLY